MEPSSERLLGPGIWRATAAVLSAGAIPQQEKKKKKKTEERNCYWFLSVSLLVT
jgi:hypothetical protein